MVVFLANRENLQTRRLHTRIKRRLRGEFTDVRMALAPAQTRGTYRVTAAVNPRSFLDDDAYATTTARLEIGFEIAPDSQPTEPDSQPTEHYWINWIEPDRNVLVGWHQDDTHADLGPVHLQVDDGSTTVAREPAHFVNSHPLDVVERRIEELPAAIAAVVWDEGRPIGIDATAPVVSP